MQVHAVQYQAIQAMHINSICRDGRRSRLIVRPSPHLGDFVIYGSGVLWTCYGTRPDLRYSRRRARPDGSRPRAHHRPGPSLRDSRHRRRRHPRSLTIRERPHHRHPVDQPHRGLAHPHRLPRPPSPRPATRPCRRCSSDVADADADQSYLDLFVSKIRGTARTSAQVCRRLPALLIDLKNTVLPVNTVQSDGLLLHLDRCVIKSFSDADERQFALAKNHQFISGASFRSRDL